MCPTFKTYVLLWINPGVGGDWILEKNGHNFMSNVNQWLLVSVY